MNRDEILAAIQAAIYLPPEAKRQAFAEIVAGMSREQLVEHGALLRIMGIAPDPCRMPAIVYTFDGPLAYTRPLNPDKEARNRLISNTKGALTPQRHGL